MCCNLCVSTDGLKGDLRAMSLQDLFESSLSLFEQYDLEEHIREMNTLQSRTLTEHQFAQLVGKLRLYQFLPSAERIFEGASTLVISSVSGMESDVNLRLSVLMMFVKIGSKPCPNR